MKVTKHMTAEQFRCALGARIKAMRENRGSTQLGFAQALGLTQGQLSRYENGRADMTIYRLDQIARALGTTGAKLLEEIS